MTPNKFQNSQQLSNLIRAKYPIIIIESSEERRVMDSIEEVAESRKKDFFCWSISSGVTKYGETKPDARFPDSIDPQAALRAMKSYNGDTAIFVMTDLHNIVNAPTGQGIGDPITVRLLRDIAGIFTRKPYTLILVSPVFKIPDDLQKDVVTLKWQLPNPAELKTFVEKFAASFKERDTITVDLNNKKLDRVVRSLQGLTMDEARNVISLATVVTRKFDESIISFVISEKKAIINQSGVATYYDTDTGIDDFGGYDVLVNFIKDQISAMTPEARAYGAKAAGGVLIVGLPGTGKTMLSKIIGGLFGAPTIRNDVGALKGSLVGESESKTRQFFKLVRGLVKVVAQIDEVEKVFGSGIGNSLDGGTSGNMFASYLTEMQEIQNDSMLEVFFVATCNDARGLRPEFIRRFQYIFFCDLPTKRERAAIVKIHIKRVKRDPKDFDISKIVDAIHGFTGSEIERLTDRAVINGFKDGARELTTEDFVQAANEIVPLANTMGPQLDEIREWALGKPDANGNRTKGRAINASLPDTVAATKGKKAVVTSELELD